MTQRIVQEKKFDHMNKWYMPKVEYILEYGTRKVIWDFEKNKSSNFGRETRPGHS